jgi:hypothetical protein
MLPRLDEIEVDLLARRARAEAENWLGEIEGIDLTLTFLCAKRDEASRLARGAPVDLGIPQLASATRGTAPARFNAHALWDAFMRTREAYSSVTG